MKVLEVIKDFVDKNGLTNIILIGSYGEIRNIEINEDEIDDEV